MPQANAKQQKWLMLSLLGIVVLVTSIAASTAIAYGATPGATSASSTLTHTPFGLARLTWDPGTKDLTVKTAITGLAPNSTHPAHIHLGVCTSNGPIAYMLSNVVADASGNAINTTVIPNIAKGIPANGWYINVHNGPGLSPADQFIPIACGNITNTNTSLAAVQNVTTNLGGTNAANQSVYGNAQLTLNQKTLTVVVTVHGLVPNTAHLAHIHAGGCQYQVPGTVLYMLKDLVADANGNATSTTIINNVTSIPANGWYINVHRTTDLSNQTNYDAISCGAVKVA